MRNVILVIVIVLISACSRGSQEESQPEPTRAVAPTFTPDPTATATLPAPTQAAEVAPTVAEPTPVPEVLLVPTATSQPIQPTQAPQGATANDVANLRSGPGTDFPIVGSTVAGQALTIVSRNAAGDWYQLGDGTWIAAFLVVGAPPDVAVVDMPVAQQPAAVENPQGAVVTTDTPVVVPVVEPTNPPFTCAGGCTESPDPSCAIKGNFNGSGGDKIYHRPGGRWYDDTDVISEEGDVWFCTAGEAEAAGYREAGK